MPPADYGATGGLSAPLQAIMREDQICIKREFRLGENCCGLQSAGNFWWFKGADDQGKVVAVTQEESSCLQRACCFGSRQAEWVTTHEAKNGPVALKVKKNFNWPCARLCCCICSQPTGHVTDGTGALLGKLEDPWTICLFNSNLTDKDGSDVYRVEGSCCVLGHFFPCCAPINLNVLEKGKPVGTITRTTLGVFDCCLQRRQWAFDFPKDSGASERALLVGALLMIDQTWIHQYAGGGGQGGES